MLQLDRELLSVGRGLLERSRRLLLDTEKLERPFGPPPAARIDPAARCRHADCLEAGLFRPVFRIARVWRIDVVNVPMRVCGAHRAAIAALASEPGFVELLRGKIGARGLDATGDLRVSFLPVN